MSQKEQTKKQAVSWNSFFNIYSYVLPYKGVFALGMIFLVLSSITALLLPAVIGGMLDVSLGSDSKIVGQLNSYLPEISINSVAFVLLGILVLQGVFSLIKVLTFAYVSESAMADIRKDLFAKLLALPLAFYDKNRVGELVSRMTNDVSQLQDALSWTLSEFFRQIATLIFGIAFIFWVSVDLSLWMISTFPVLIIFAVFFGRFIKKLSKKTQDELAKTNVITDETLQNITAVKSFTNEDYEYNRYAAGIKKVVNLALKTAAFRGGFATFIILGIFGGIILVFWRGAHLIEQGTLFYGEFTSFIMYTIYIGASVGGIGDIYSRILKAVGATERIRDILGEHGEADNQATEAFPAKAAISFDNVDFSYPTRQDVAVLKGLNISINEGEKIALVGSSGAGKSTIVQLLMRFYRLTEGDIKLNDKSINDIELNQLRANIGIVPQEVILFGGTIKENILYGNPKASESEVIEAAKKANALEFIQSFPDGFETVVGERGVKLSGGQRQRVAIARAILRNPTILILDEATSSLDSESELQVQTALNELMKGRTSIIIAHRLSTIRNVDRIYVIENGKVIEHGSHVELLENENGVYKNFIDLQNEAVLN